MAWGCMMMMHTCMPHAGLARLATTFFFKDDLGLSPAETAALTGIFSLPWIIKVRKQQASQQASQQDDHRWYREAE